jgi:septal ring factor EnvC (AmiA/AmiB activator)
MSQEIDQLEDRIRRAVARIRELEADNARLAGEVKTVRAALARTERASRAPRVPEAWTEGVRDALHELRNG